MHLFSSKLNEFCSEMESTISDFRNSCDQASDMMRDESGQRAIRILMSLSEDLYCEIGKARELSQSVLKSAELIEDSDNLLS